MNNSEKYIPKVGEAFEWYGGLTESWKRESEVVAATKKTIAFINQDDVIQALRTDSKFRPIPTKADVEREQLTRLISDSYSRCTGPDYCAKNIIKAGFTIPKKVKRSDVFDAVFINSTMDEARDNYIVNAICKLLGDLVEDEA